MAIALDTSADLGNTATTSLTAAYTCTGSNLILYVGVFNFQNIGISDTVTGVTYNSIAMTQVGVSVQVPANTGYWVSLWRLVAPATGAHIVVVSLSANVLICYASAVSYTGVNQNSPIDITGSTTANASSISKSLVTTVNNDWTIAITQATDGTFSAGTGTTLRTGNGGNTAIFDSNGAITPAGNTTLNANLTVSRNMAMIMAGFSPINSSGFLAFM